MTYSDGDMGDYRFENMTPGVYVVVEKQPDFYDSVWDYDTSTNENDEDGDDRADGADNDIPVLLLPHEEDCGNDFVEDPFVGSITGLSEMTIGTPMENVDIEVV